MSCVSLASTAECRQVYDKCARSATEPSPTTSAVASTRGEFAAGACCPARAELSAAYDASRVTVRKALEVLRDEGLVDSRQGFGWFVATDPVRQSLGRLGTIEAQLGELGVSSERRVVDFRFIAAAAPGAPGARRRHRARGAPGQPAPTASRSPGSRCGAPRTSGPGSPGPTSSARRSTSCSTSPIGGAVQTIGAAAAGRDDAALLAVPVGSPVLRCERVTNGVDGRPRARVRARVPRAPHRVRGRAAPRGAVDRPDGPAPGGVTGAISPVASARRWRRACTPAASRRPLRPPPRRRASP